MPQQHTRSDVEKITPFLKWAGGKRWLIANHAEVFPLGYSRYIEPFLGSGAVFFHFLPKKALLSDINADLINVYHTIRNDWQRLESALVVLQERHSDDYYYVVRSWCPTHPVERAARFIYLNRTCWNGLYRVNRRGEFNVPRGTKNNVVLDTDAFETIARRLKGVSIQVADFEDSINEAKKGDLVFVDPPYTVKHNLNGFVKYNDKIFLWEDQIRLRNALVRANSRGAYVVMTNANHQSVRELYSHFFLRPLQRQSVLSGLVGGRGATEELLITNFC